MGAVDRACLRLVKAVMAVGDQMDGHLWVW